MFFFLSKFLPVFIFPLGLVCALLGLALMVRRRSRWQMWIVALALALLWLGSNRIVTNCWITNCCAKLLSKFKSALVIIYRQHSTTICNKQLNCAQAD